MNRLLLSIAILLASGPALAAGLGDLVPPEEDASACWRRLYSEAHLAANPDQQVTEFGFFLSFVKYDAADPGSHYFGLEAKLRDGRHGRAAGACFEGDDGRMRCGVDCDGGGVVLRQGNGGDLLVDLDAVGYISLESMCGGGDEESHSFALLPGLDDKLFLLHPAEPKQCKALMPEW